jgi:hypothetical protein
MRLIKLIVPAAAFAALALFAPHAEAQTMGEYATTVGVASDDSSSFGGGSRTWGASSLGGTFDERAGAASSSAGAVDFDSRAGSTTGSDSGSRFPTESRLSDSSDRFGGSSDRFGDTDRFGQSQFQDQDRFPSSAFNDNRMGLDTNYNSK